MEVAPTTINEIVEAAGGDAHDSDGISFKEFCDAMERADRESGEFTGFLVESMAEGKRRIGRAREAEAAEIIKVEEDGAGGVVEEKEEELPEGKGEAHLEERRKLLSVLGKGVGAEDLPPAGILAAPSAWGEPPDDGLHTLPERGLDRVLATRRQLTMGRILGEGHAVDAGVRKREEEAKRREGGGVEEGGVVVDEGMRSLCGFVPGIPGEDPLAGPAKVPEVSRHRRHNRVTRRKISDRLAQLYGSGPRGMRKAFVKFARSTDGSTSIAAAAEGLRQLGVPVSAKDIARMVAEGREGKAKKRGGGGGKGGAKGGGKGGEDDLTEGLSGATRLDFDTFARAIDRLDFAPSTIPAPYNAPSGMQEPPAPALGDEEEEEEKEQRRVRWEEEVGSVAGTTVSTREAVKRRESSGLRHKDRAVRDICQRISDRLGVSGLPPSRIFLKVDAQRDGMLTHDEVREGLGRLGVDVNDAELKSFVSAVDPKNTGFVDYTHFVQALFPPDIDPMERAHPLPTGGGGVAGFGKKRVSKEVAAAYAGSPRGRWNRSDLDLDAFDPEDIALAKKEAAERAKARGVGEGEAEEWEREEEVDESGVFAGERDKAYSAAPATELRKKHFYGPAPHLTGLISRDTEGTPADFLTSESGREGPLAARAPDPTRELALRKKENALLRRVSAALENRAGTRELFMKLNRNHDGSVSLPELRSGLARLGVHLKSDEFRILLRRMDVDNSGNIEYAEFARALKQDDPLPDDKEIYVPTRVGYTPHRYRPPVEGEETSPTGPPRVATDSRAAYVSIDAPEAAAKQAASVEEARMATEVVDRLVAKKGSLRSVFVRLGLDKTGKVRAGDLRRELANQGVHLSHRQVDAFLGNGRVSRDARLSYSDFVELARPRCAVDETRLGQPIYGGEGESAAVEAARARARGEAGGVVRTGVGVDATEGIGRYGASPPQMGDDMGDARAAEFVRYTNTDPHGIWDPADGDPSKASRARAQGARTVAELAAAEEHEGRVVAGKLVRRDDKVRRGYSAESSLYHGEDSASLFSPGGTLAEPDTDIGISTPLGPRAHIKRRTGKRGEGGGGEGEKVERRLEMGEMDKLRLRILRPKVHPTEVFGRSKADADRAFLEAEGRRAKGPRGAAPGWNPALMRAAGVRSSESVQRDFQPRADAARKQFGPKATAFAQSSGGQTVRDVSYPSGEPHSGRRGGSIHTVRPLAQEVHDKIAS